MTLYTLPFDTFLLDHAGIEHALNHGSVSQQPPPTISQPTSPVHSLPKPVSETHAQQRPSGTNSVTLPPPSRVSTPRSGWSLPPRTTPNPQLLRKFSPPQRLEPGRPSPMRRQQARWPSGLRRYVKEFLNNIIIFRGLDSVVRKGVGSNPTLVTPFIFAGEA
jgi:hypothetical protein